MIPYLLAVLGVRFVDLRSEFATDDDRLHTGWVFSMANDLVAWVDWIDAILSVVWVLLKQGLVQAMRGRTPAWTYAIVVVPGGLWKDNDIQALWRRLGVDSYNLSMTNTAWFYAVRPNQANWAAEILRRHVAGRSPIPWRKR